MSNNKTFEYKGKAATVSWDGGLCIHISECGRAKGDLFVGGRKPWCDPDLSSSDEILDVIRRCPSGALSVEFAGAGNTETAPDRNQVQVTYNGPLFVTGDLDIEDAPTDAAGLRFRAALCRCGQSRNKPYCDNSHESANFRDYGAVGEAGGPDVEAGGPLEIRFVTNGPILVSGNVTLRASTGRDAWHGKKAALCRCGASENKPFCDGSHKKIGFESA